MIDTPESRLIGRIARRLSRNVTRAVVAAFAASIAGAAAPCLVAQPSPTAILDGLRADGRRPIDFHAAAFPDTVYVGQQVTYQVAVLLSERARSRLRRNPEFLPPELRGLLAYELGTPGRAAPRSYGDGVFEAYVFQRALFAVKPGLMAVPAPQLSYSLPQSASYFSREESFVVRAESVQVVARPLPEEGRPAEFTGAVGVLRATARFDAASARVGDPLVLTVRLEGTGNVKLLPRPSLKLSWASVVPGSERVQVDSSGPLVRGAREFDFLLTPTQPGAAVLPLIRYSYFDPYRGEYAWAETRPADVMIADGALAVPVEGDETAAVPLRPWRQENTAPLPSWPALWRLGGGALWLLAPMPALVALWQRRRRARAHGVRGEEESSRPLPDPLLDATPAGDARRVRRHLLAQLAERLDMPAFDLIGHREVEQGLRRRGVTRATTRDVLALLDDLAQRGFGAQGSGSDTADASALQSRATTLLERVHAEAVARARARRWVRRGPPAGGTAVASGLVVASLLAGALSPAGLGAQAASPQPLLVSGADSGKGAAPAVAVAQLVQEGSAAYAARRFQRASEVFGEASAARPFDADLLVNWGSAAWAAGDTVSAVIAWQRAARLDPLAADVQERLLVLPAGTRGVLADVPMVPVQALAVAGTALWVSGWMLLLVHWRRRGDHGAAPSAPLRSAGAAMVLLASVAGVAAWWGTQALDARALAVVRRPESLRQSPGFDANTLGGVGTGDIVRLEAAQEGWARIAHADGRRGWIVASRLAPLVSPTSPR